MHIKVKYLAPNLSPLHLLQQAHETLKRSQLIIARMRKQYLVRLRAIKAKTKLKVTQQTQVLLQREFQKKLIELELNYQRLIAAANRDCLQLSLSIAQQVIECELKLNHESLLSRIKQVLANMLDQRQLKIFINPSDQPALQKYLQDNFSEMNWQVIALDEIGSGNARLEMASGTLELSWQEDLNLIATKLKQKLANTLKVAA